MTNDGFLFAEDREKANRQAEWDRRAKIYGTPEFDIEYSRYIKSPLWHKLCREVKKRARNLCEHCIAEGLFTSRRLSVHHTTYERFKHELLSDLELLCPNHHEIADRARKQRVQGEYEVRGEEMRDAAALNTFMTKKYDEDWEERIGYDMERAWEEFNDWLERRREDDYY